MTWYGDLSSCDYFGTSQPERLLAVGWLTAGKPFAKGAVAPDVLAKVERLAEDALRIFVFRGFHRCELCGTNADERLVDSQGVRVASSSHLNIFVPHHDKLFVAPQCLPHYITGHEYCPPDEFCDAVLRCPEPGGPNLAYAIRDVGGPEFARELEMAERIRSLVARGPGGNTQADVD